MEEPTNTEQPRMVRVGSVTDARESSLRGRMDKSTNTGQPRMDEHSPSTIHGELARHMESYTDVRQWMETNHSPVNNTTSLHLHFLDYDDQETNVSETDVSETDVQEMDNNLADKLSNDLKTLCQLTDGIFLTSGAGKIVRSALKKSQSALKDFYNKGSIAVAIPTMENLTELDGLDSFNHILWSDSEDVQGHLQSRLISAAELDQTKPSICLMVGGGPQTLKRACYALERNIPIILMKGSRGLADRLVESLANTTDKQMKQLLEGLQRLENMCKAYEEGTTHWDKERERQHVENELKAYEEQTADWDTRTEEKKAKLCQCMKKRLKENLKILETKMKGDKDEFYPQMKARLEEDLKVLESENKGDGVALCRHMTLRLEEDLEILKSKMEGNAAKFFKNMTKRLEKDLERVKDVTRRYKFYESKADDLKTWESALKEILRIPGSLEQQMMFCKMLKMRHLVTVYNPTDDPQQEYLDTAIVKALMKCKKTAEVESILPSMLHRYKKGYQNSILCSRLHGYQQTEGEQTDGGQRNTYGVSFQKLQMELLKSAIFNSSAAAIRHLQLSFSRRVIDDCKWYTLVTYRQHQHTSDRSKERLHLYNVFHMDNTALSMCRYPCKKCRWTKEVHPMELSAPDVPTKKRPHEMSKLISDATDLSHFPLPREGLSFKWQLFLECLLYETEELAEAVLDRMQFYTEKITAALFASAIYSGLAARDGDTWLAKEKQKTSRKFEQLSIDYLREKSIKSPVEAQYMLICGFLHEQYQPSLLQISLHIKAKHFLADNICRKHLDDIWHGRTPFTLDTVGDCRSSLSTVFTPLVGYFVRMPFFFFYNGRFLHLLLLLAVLLPIIGTLLTADAVTGII